MKKVVSLALLTTTLAFSQSGIMGGSEGLHQINAKTLGQWQINLGTGGNFAFGSWALSRGGVYEVMNKNGYTRYSFNDADLSYAGNVFVSVGLLDFLDVGTSLPVYYEHANSKGPGGSANMWTTSRGDLDLFIKLGLPFASTNVFSPAILLDWYIPTGEEFAGVRPRHVWYLNSQKNTHPFTANDWVFGAGLAFTFDFTKLGAPITWNLAASYVYPLDHSETNTLVYSSGLNVNVLSWLTPFVEFSAEMRLQSKGRYKFDPLVDPMLLTPGLRFHLPYNVELAIGVDVAVRAFIEGFDHQADINGGNDHIIYNEGEHGVVARYGYASTPFISGSALLSIAFDAKSKPKDSDGDGVFDETDKCARTPVGAKVDVDGCPVVVEDTTKLAREKAIADSLARVDSDNDGIPDVSDKCPNSMVGISVDSIGCMLDFDKDGVADNYDKCPNTPSGVPVSMNGCPMDFDNDGVPDYLDKCPNTAVNMEVDSTGCVFDSDHDGIPDYKDKCPGSLAGYAVDTLGCLPDIDNDGVADAFDVCPNTLPSIRVDEKGCPLNKNEDLDQLKKGIQFKSGAKKLTTSSYRTLNDLVKLMNKILDLNIEVQGHTDNRGAEKKNLKLSATRAKAVVDYLIKKGIDSDRLRAVGYGSEKPIADNDNADGRAQNRRVELVPFAK